MREELVDEMFWRTQAMVLNFLAPLISVLVALPVVFYIVARWRQYKEGIPADPHLGFKVALSFFRVTSYQTCLAGLFLFVYGMLSDLPDQVQSILFRTAFGLLVPGFLIWMAHFVAITKTNSAELPQVARMFSGLALVQTGIIAMFALIFTFVVVFQKGDSGEAGRLGWSMVIVYVIAWVVQAAMFGRDLFTGAPPPGVAQFAQRPAPPPSAPPPSGGME